VTRVTVVSRASRSALRAAAMGLVLAVTGCGGVALERSFTDYSAVQADSSNRQLLLNLARMSNAHPPHFLQLGLINTTFQFAVNANANVGGSQTSGRSPAEGPLRLLQRALTWAFNFGGAASEQPTFSLTPLSGPQFAGGFVAAVPAAVFFSLVEHGKPIDQIMRTLVQSVELEDGCGNRRMVLNAPSRDNPEAFAKFLRLMDIAAELQRHELLRVDRSTTLDPIPSSPLFAAPTVDETLKAVEKGFMFKEAPPKPTGADAPVKYTLAKITTTTTLEVVRGSRTDTLWADMAKRPYFRREPDERKCPDDGRKEGRLTMALRSFLETLHWVATEEEEFDAIVAGPEGPAWRETVPPTQRRPVLRLTWREVAEALEPPVATLKYGDRTYTVTDVRGSRWNRNVFSLLSFIESQVSLDPKQLPVQQLINVR
jgi:hypothetical protein